MSFSMRTSALSLWFHEIVNTQTTSLTPNYNRNYKLLGPSRFRFQIRDLGSNPIRDPAFSFFFASDNNGEYYISSILSCHKKANCYIFAPTLLFPKSQLKENFIIVLLVWIRVIDLQSNSFP